MSAPTETKKFNSWVRPPVVVVMGHVDHGKTTMLDWYRKTSVALGESGGITQHIGAYEVAYKEKRITFIDTPGHESFSKMRSRGAKIADIAILVVAADDGVKSQTKEAIKIIKENNLSFVVAINKIDKPEANTQRVIQQLAEADVLVEEYGGKIPSVEISAKTGKNMEELLDVILLVAELEHLTADPGKHAEGVVIEARLDKRRGITATLLVRDGTLRRNDTVVVGSSLEAIKILENFRGERIDAAGPSLPARIVGLKILPVVGETFRGFSKKADAEAFVKTAPLQRVAAPPRVDIAEKGCMVFNIILKTDVAGSKEAIEDELKKLNTEAIGISILKSEVGDINETDVKLASATKLVTIVGFRVSLDASTRELAQNLNIRIITGDVIYELLDALKRAIEEMMPPIIERNDIGRAKILKVFKRDGARQVVGGRVEAGVAQHNALFEAQRAKNILGRGTIRELRMGRQTVTEVSKGSEFGLLVESSIPIEAGDILLIFKEVVTKRKL